jgi:hypothetical protein
MFVHVRYIMAHIYAGAYGTMGQNLSLLPLEFLVELLGRFRMMETIFKFRVDTFIRILALGAGMETVKSGCPKSRGLCSPYC